MQRCLTKLLLPLAFSWLEPVERRREIRMAKNPVRSTTLRRRCRREAMLYICTVKVIPYDLPGVVDPSEVSGGGTRNIKADEAAVVIKETVTSSAVERTDTGIPRCTPREQLRVGAFRNS
jgi:hypothetical protein